MPYRCSVGLCCGPRVSTMYHAVIRSNLLTLLSEYDEKLHRATVNVSLFSLGLRKVSDMRLMG